MILAKLNDAVAFYVDVKITTLNAGEVHFPDFDGRRAIESGVIETDVNTAFEGFIEFADAVRCQYEDTGIVFQYAEKYLRFLEERACES